MNYRRLIVAVLLQSFLLTFACVPNLFAQDSYFTALNTLISWPTNRIPIKVYAKSGAGVTYYQPEFESILKQSFKDWAAASNGKINFVFVNSPDDANIKCSWTDDLKQMMSSTEGGHAVVVPDDKGIREATIVILTKPGRSQAELSTNEMRRVCLHEVGHALGITAHSPLANDIMYASTTVGANSQLTDRDKNTLLALYSSSRPTNTVDAGKATVSGDATNPVTKCLLLNNEAAVAMQQKNFPLALKKLESAHALDPSNELVGMNLGGMYSNLAAMTMILHNFPAAEIYIKKAIPLLEKGSNKDNLIALLKNYDVLLRSTNRLSESKSVEERLQKLQDK